MNTQTRTFFFVLSLLAVSVIMAAPGWAQTNTNPSGNPEVKYGVYNVSQEVEFGGRIVDNSGSNSIWSTFVNQNSGARLLSESFEMHSPTHNGFLFDDLSLNSFGFGGDPNSVARVKVLKGKWYTFQANFRRDKSFFDYNLLDNQLNAVGVAANVGASVSPHLSQLTRKMQDYSLNLFPVSRFKVRLGYSFGDQYGDMLSSGHFGADGQFDRPWRTTTQTYRAGFTFKVVQGTSISFDHILNHFKNDTSTKDYNQFFSVNGKPVDLGLGPCATAVSNPAICNGFYAYNQFQPVRSDIPMDTLGLTSTYKRFNQTAHVSYSGGDMVVPRYTEFNDGLTTRTNLRQASAAGNAWNKRVSAGADYSATLTINDHFRLVESFRWDNFRIPTSYNNVINNLFVSSSLVGGKVTSNGLAAGPQVWDPTKCPAPYTAVTCPLHVASSAADIQSQYFYNFLGQDQKTNLISAEFDVNRHFGGHVGFKYDARTVTIREGQNEADTLYPGGATVASRNAACTGAAVSAGVCNLFTTTVDGETYDPTSKGAVFGLWLRPNDTFRVALDTELMSTDHPFVVIAPKTFQLYRIKSSYRPKDWFNLAIGANLLQRNNDEQNVDNKQHNRSINIDSSLFPNGRYGLDLSYSYSDVFSNADFCYFSTPNVLGAPACTATTAANLWSTVSLYNSKSQFGAFNFRFNPTSRFRGQLGYTVSRNAGSATLTNVLMSLGPLDSIYHMPSASFEVDLNKSLTWKTAWNYYGYEEGSYQTPGVVPQRDARGSVFTLSLKYKLGGER